MIIGCFCNIALTHLLCIHGRSWMCCFAQQKLLLHSCPQAVKYSLNFVIPFSVNPVQPISLQLFKVNYIVVAWMVSVMAGGTSDTVKSQCRYLWSQVVTRLRLLDPEGKKSTMVLQNIRNYTPNEHHYTAEDLQLQQHHYDDLRTCTDTVWRYLSVLWLELLMDFVSY
jgi:hypothetical protein